MLSPGSEHFSFTAKSGVAALLQKHKNAEDKTFSIMFDSSVNAHKKK